MLSLYGEQETTLLAQTGFKQNNYLNNPYDTTGRRNPTRPPGVTSPK